MVTPTKYTVLTAVEETRLVTREIHRRGLGIIYSLGREGI
jgi:hypothetical protein